MQKSYSLSIIDELQSENNLLRRQNRAMRRGCRNLVFRLQHTKKSQNPKNPDSVYPLSQKAENCSQCAFAFVQNVFDALPLQVWAIEADGTYILLNQAHASFSGKLREEMIGQNINRFWSTEYVYIFKELMEKALQSGQEQRLEKWLRNSYGISCLLQICAYPISSQSWKIHNIIFTAEDITERRKSELNLQQTNQQLALQSLEDELTRIPNRRCFNSILKREWGRSLRLSSTLSLLMIDIDHFKEYNDTYGHLAGDNCLMRVAEVLKTSVNRSTDLISRFGGEEFTVMLPDTGLDGARCMAQKLRRNIQKLGIQHQTSKVSDQLTVSVGIGLADPHAADIKNLSEACMVSAADQALYAAKNNGRNTIAWKPAASDTFAQLVK